MFTKIDKRDRATLFRDRIGQAMREQQISQSALARGAGVDRSTVNQILKGDGARLPNAQVVAQCAAVLGVSADWLLGLSERPEQASDLVAASLTMPEAPRALVDESIFGWHQEAAGYKIRHVPAGLPDMLKLPDMLRWEYEPSLGRTTDQAIGASRDRLEWMAGSRSDYEIALPRHEVESFARGEGYYDGVPEALRRAQIEQMITLHEQLYPKMRVFLFDARRLFSAPVTIFGPLLAVVYLGRNYLAFRDSERVLAITDHFDRLIREASASDRDWPDVLKGLLDEM
ncbi:helix-turn-helix domain-containing protein [Pelagovum sp. HNIBRBA483]|uniref:helix-turn-helix domain-containing protein n=1 Tax=Pelagovum sp. HNIBRBA483 TaxID=3233341 RepID=UPI0034A5943F